MKDSAPKVAELAKIVEAADPRGIEPLSGDQRAWLEQNVEWQLEGAATMLWATRNLASEDALPGDDPVRDIDSGLREVAAPLPYVPTIVSHWRGEIGKSSCHVVAPTMEETQAFRERMKMPTPAGATADQAKTVETYREKAKGVRDVAAIACGGSKRLLVGMYGDKLVPLVLEDYGSGD